MAAWFHCAAIVAVSAPRAVSAMKAKIQFSAKPDESGNVSYRLRPVGHQETRYVQGDRPPYVVDDRRSQITTALRLVTISVAFGILSGTVSIVTGLQDHSLGVFAVGLGVAADVTGSATLIWRFRAERRHAGGSAAAEAQAAIVVGMALAVVSAVLIIESAVALSSGSRPGTSVITLIAASISLLVLGPLAAAKRRLGGRIASPSLRGDGTLSAIGAATSFLALVALVLYHALGWWWGDRAAALVVAAIAAVEAWRLCHARHTDLTTMPDHDRR
jgi:divalent metal cation (Fe/Co/Zn/Cd) transporter